MHPKAEPSEGGNLSLEWPTICVPLAPPIDECHDMKACAGTCSMRRERNLRFVRCRDLTACIASSEEEDVLGSGKAPLFQPRSVRAIQGGCGFFLSL
mmetsp:Transcript_57639/g.114414  ORF Transcript_57639/g.114414 Transcript_57639/m.114414 type:complete len:97 (+) Transcript_57639:563-853(+)